jgi:hypothetical protein
VNSYTVWKSKCRNHAGPARNIPRFCGLSTLEHSPEDPLPIEFGPILAQSPIAVGILQLEVLRGVSSTYKKRPDTKTSTDKPIAVLKC